MFASAPRAYLVPNVVGEFPERGEAFPGKVLQAELETLCFPRERVLIATKPNRQGLPFGTVFGTFDFELAVSIRAQPFGHGPEAFPFILGRLGRGCLFSNTGERFPLPHLDDFHFRVAILPRKNVRGVFYSVKQPSPESRPYKSPYLHRTSFLGGARPPGWRPARPSLYGA